MRKILVLLTLITGLAFGQLQQSGGPGSSVAVTSISAGTNVIGRFGLDQTTPGTTNAISIGYVAGSAIATAAAGIMKVGVTDGTGTAITSTGAALDINIKSGSIANTTFGLVAGTANIGFVRVLPSSCTQSTNFANATAQVATGAGTTVTSTTTCVTHAYANNITNAAVTLRLADKAGTPVIWLGGNADFSIPANSNIHIPIDGVIFTSGITAIAGTASAINLQINGVQ